MRSARKREKKDKEFIAVLVWEGKEEAEHWKNPRPRRWVTAERLNLSISRDNAKEDGVCQKATEEVGDGGNRGDG